MTKCSIKNIVIVTVFSMFLFPVSAHADFMGELAGCTGADVISLSGFLYLFVQIAQWILGITGSLALLMFVIGGFVWLISGGSKKMVDMGKATLTNALFGMAIVFGSWMLIGFIMQTIAPNVGGWSSGTYTFNGSLCEPARTTTLGRKEEAPPAPATPSSYEQSLYRQGDLSATKEEAAENAKKKCPDSNGDSKMEEGADFQTEYSEGYKAWAIRCKGLECKSGEQEAQNPANKKGCGDVCTAYAKSKSKNWKSEHFSSRDGSCCCEITVSEATAGSSCVTQDGLNKVYLDSECEGVGLYCDHGEKKCKTKKPDGERCEIKSEDAGNGQKECQSGICQCDMSSGSCVKKCGNQNNDQIQGACCSFRADKDGLLGWGRKNERILSNITSLSNCLGEKGGLEAASTIILCERFCKGGTVQSCGTVVDKKVTGDSCASGWTNVGECKE